MKQQRFYSRASGRAFWSLLLWFTAIAATWAQGYGTPDVSRFQASSAYYVTLVDADGNSLDSQYAGTPGAIGAFVGGELRGVSQYVTLGGHSVYLIRVWGGDDDTPTVTFRLRNKSLEYVLDTHAFGCGSDITYSTPSAPISLKFVPVTGIEISPSNITVYPTNTLNVHVNLLPTKHTALVALPTYQYKSSDTSVFTISNDGLLTAVAKGNAQLTVEAQVNAVTLFTATAPVSVTTTTIDVTGIRNDMSSLWLDQEVGSEFELLFTILPENATNRKVTYRVDDLSVVTYYEDDAGRTHFRAVKAGRTDITVTTVDGGFTLTYTVNVLAPAVEDLTLVFPDEVTLSKFMDVAVTLMQTPASAKLHPELISFEFDNSPNAGWGAVATATMADKTGLKWNLRGLFAGNYSYTVSYNGKAMQTKSGKAKGTLHIPVQYALAYGWNWLSLYAVSEANGNVFPLKKDGEWSYIKVNESNYVAEIRSQQKSLLYDPVEGYFGDIEVLTPSEGAYKLKMQLANPANKLIIGVGADRLKFASAMELPKIHKGATWVTYPHELDHSLSVLAEHLSKTAQRGDLIIGQNGFAEFTGMVWDAPEHFKFEAGKGYIYYTEGEGGKAINWGPATLPPDPVETTTDDEEESRSIACEFANSMPVVARLTNEASEECIVEAYVDNEYRGHGFVTNSGLLHVSVAGQPGERVSFRLFDPSTGNYSKLDQQLDFTTRQGSFCEPVLLTVADVCKESRLSVSWHQGILTVSGCEHPTISVCDITGRSSWLYQGTRLALPFLDTGFYIVTVSDGNDRVTIKIKK